MSDWNGTASHWQYSRWLKNVARNSKQTLPTGAELAAVRTFLKAIWNPAAQTGTRSWLDPVFKRRAVASVTDDYDCNIDNEPSHVLIVLMEIVGRDFKKIPMTAAEKALADTLITATGNRKYGTTPYFGSVGGSTVSIP